MSEFWRLSATALAAAVRSKQISAHEAVAQNLARLVDVNPKLNAVVAHDTDAVLARANELDAMLARGEDPGPLAGVPVTIKVITDQAGFPTTNGTLLQKNLMAEQNSPVVDNFLRAGAVLLGRTNTPAFSLRWFTSNLVHGATRNPHDPALTPGGSSGGAAAAVASGIGHIGHGTDIAGSIRYPAYACGLHGLRPSFGRIPAYNATASDRHIGPQLTAVSGPIARSMEDIGLAFAAMAAPDWRDPWYVPAPLQGPDYAKRVALVLRPGGLAIVPEVEAALKDAAARLADAGWTVEEWEDLPHLEEAAALQGGLWMGDHFEPMELLAVQDGDPGAIAAVAGIKAAIGEVSAEGTSRALVRRATMLRDYMRLLQDCPVLLMPVSAELPFPDQLDMQDYARVWRAQLTQIALPFLGLPALAVATGRAGNVPVGVQLVAARFREDILIHAGADIERAGQAIVPVDPVF